MKKNKLAEFLGECKVELDKVVWPTKEETVNATWIVIISVFLLVLFVYGVDVAFLFGFKGLLN